MFKKFALFFGILLGSMTACVTRSSSPSETTVEPEVVEASDSTQVSLTMLGVNASDAEYLSLLR